MTILTVESFDKSDQKDVFFFRVYINGVFRQFSSLGVSFSHISKIFTLSGSFGESFTGVPMYTGNLLFILICIIISIVSYFFNSNYII